MVFVATFVDGLDSSAVNIALPWISREMSVDASTASWATAAYLTVLAALLVPFARISADGRVGGVMWVGLTVFMASSVLCGLAPDFPSLVVFRVVQGVGAAMIAAAGPVCCTEFLPRAQLATGLAVITGGSGLGFALGPSFGGFVIDLAGWRWIFLINVVPCALGIAAAIASMPRGRAGGRRLDVPGAALIGVAVASAIVCLETLSDGGPAAPSAGIIALLALSSFVHVERRADDPILDLGTFGCYGFSRVFVMLMLVNALSLGELYLLPFYCHISLGMSATEAGLYIMVASAVVAVFSVPVARWSDRVGDRRLFCAAGGLLFAAAMAMLLYDPGEAPAWVLALSMAVKGFAWCFAGGPLSSSLVEHAGDDRDMASSLTNEALYVGGAAGTAGIAAMFAFASSTAGTDISSVTSEVMVDGFVPCIAFLAAVGLLIAAIALSVRDARVGGRLLNTPPA